MTLTRWIGGKTHELMPEGYVAATYNLVENEIPINFQSYYNSNVRTIYKTELEHRADSLIVTVGNTPVSYIERGGDFKEFEITDLVSTGYLRMSYIPRQAEDYFGTAKLQFNKSRTWIYQKFLTIDKDVINQIRVAIAAIENQIGLVSTRWTGGIFTDTKATATGTPNVPASFNTNIVNEQTLFVSIIADEISIRLVELAAKTNVSITDLSTSIEVKNSMSPRWIESVRTIINRIELVV